MQNVDMVAFFRMEQALSTNCLCQKGRNFLADRIKQEVCVVGVLKKRELAKFRKRCQERRGAQNGDFTALGESPR